MWCLCKETETDYFIVNLNTGAKIYIDDSGYPSYQIVYEIGSIKTILKSFETISGYCGDIDDEFPYVMKDIFEKLQKGESFEI